MTKTQLASVLSRFGIAPTTIRFPASTAKGYYRASFEAAVSRFGETSVTP
jgi:hypothetical protein